MHDRARARPGDPKAPRTRAARRRSASRSAGTTPGDGGDRDQVARARAGGGRSSSRPDGARRHRDRTCAGAARRRRAVGRSRATAPGRRPAATSASYSSAGDVVVVALEAPARDAVRGGERVQLVERRVADQVRPEPAVRRPSRRVDEDRHASAGLPPSASPARRRRRRAAAATSGRSRHRRAPWSTSRPGRTDAPRWTRGDAGPHQPRNVLGAHARRPRSPIAANAGVGRARGRAGRRTRRPCRARRRRCGCRPGREAPARRQARRGSSAWSKARSNVQGAPAIASASARRRSTSTSRSRREEAERRSPRRPSDEIVAGQPDQPRELAALGA